MVEEKKQKDLLLASFVADSYSLGSHWVYDEKKLALASINWNVLNAPMSLWHKGKGAGEFTHYGDQTLWLYEYLKDKNSFDDKDFMMFWFEKMKTYNGYVDSATKQSMQNIANGIYPSGSLSTDLSIVGRIAPLLKVSKDKNEFLENVEKFVRITHNSAKALISANFFAKLLLMTIEGKDIEESIEYLKDSLDSSFQKMITQGIESKNEDTFNTIKNFGTACDIDGGFPSVIHLLCKYKNFKDMLICNAKVGGDTSSRAMVCAIIFMAKESIAKIPHEWLEIQVNI